MARLAIHTYFGTLKDPRRAPRHLLLDIIGIAICAVICGADTFEEVERFGQAKHGWLKRFLASRGCQVGWRTLTGSWVDGFVHAGNLAYLSLLTLFPFFIVVNRIRRWFRALARLLRRASWLG